MNSLKPPTRIEQIAGNVATESALVVVAAMVGGPLAPLLPVLAKSLASERQRNRVESALIEIENVLNMHQTQIRDLTDSQYKIINEAVLALLHTTQSEKLKYLRAVVRSALEMTDIQSQEATILSRVIRDISAEEADFLVTNFSSESIQLTTKPGDPHAPDDILRINPTSRDTLIVSGLLSLGLLVPSEPIWGEPNRLRFSAIVAKLIVLFQARDA